MENRGSNVAYLLVVLADNLTSQRELLTRLQRIVANASGTDNEFTSTGKHSFVVAFIPTSEKHLGQLQRELQSRQHPIGVPYLLTPWTRSAQSNFDCMNWVANRLNSPYR